MSKEILFCGAAVMIIIGTVFKQTSMGAVGLGLMWVGLSMIKNSHNLTKESK